ncbi:5-hydroxytryptamine receptor 2C [Pangasianodon hypophthalmus]|uniref:5-hydroxytryptamine receptor 2C n=1 Tax=Pangasianodon hypophthalmus TaxID=310915 RepID=UPI002306DFB4|nr:5-hydroxytryptamine receptor 2C [Pangasianodon hypophthalmus]
MVNPGRPYCSLTMASLHSADSNNQSHSGSNYSGLVTSCTSQGKNWPALIILVIIFFTVGGNILVILAVSLEKKLHNATNFFLRSLAVADLLVGVLVMPAALINILYNYSWPLPHVLCPMWIFLDVLFCTASIMHLCAISLDRYVGIRSPIQHSRTNSPYRAMTKITAVWTISMVISVPIPVISLQDEQKVLVNGSCVLTEPRFILVGSFVVFFLPLIIMVVCYCLTMRVLQQHLATFSTECRNCANTKQPSPQPSLLRVLQHLSPPLRVRDCTGPRGQGKRRMAQAIKNERRACQVLGVVFFLFLVMWCPFFITNVLIAMCQDGCSKHLLRLMDIFVWVGYVSSGVNPLIYTLFNKNYRHVFSRYLRCSYHKHAKPVLSNSACQVYSVTPTPVLCERSFTDTNANSVSGFAGSTRVHKQDEMLKEGVSNFASSKDNISRV